jgi:hypothetical protein
LDTGPSSAILNFRFSEFKSGFLVTCPENYCLKMIDIIFSLKKETTFGCFVAVASSLNNWDVKNSVILNWQAPDLWQGSIRVYPDKDIEYKYFIKQKDSEIWENISNRRIPVSKYSSNSLVIKVHDTWENPVGHTKISENRAKSLDLRVMTFNIRYDTVMDGKYRWSQRSHLVASVIRLHKGK